MLCNARLRKHLCTHSVGVDGFFCTRHASTYQAYGPLRVKLHNCLSSKSSHFVDVTRNAHYTFDHNNNRVYKLHVSGRHMDKVGDGMAMLTDGTALLSNTPWYICAVAASQDNDLFMSCVETYALSLLVEMFVYMERHGKESEIDQLAQVVDKHTPDVLEALTRLCDQQLVQSKRFTRVLYTAAQKKLPMIMSRPGPLPFRLLLSIVARCGLSDHTLVVDALTVCAYGRTTRKNKVVAQLFQALLSLRADQWTTRTLLRSPVLKAYGILGCVKQLLRLIPMIMNGEQEGRVTSYAWIRQQIKSLMPNDAILTDWVLWNVMRGTESLAVQFCIRQGKLTSLCEGLERVVQTTGAKHLPELAEAGLPVTVFAPHRSHASDSLIHRLAQKADENDRYMEALDWLLETDHTHATLPLRADRKPPRVALETPLHTAIWFRQWRTVELLLSHGASPHTQENSSMVYALYRGHTPTLQKLLDHSFESVRDNTQWGGQSELDLFCTRILTYAIDYHIANDTTLEWLVRYITTHNSVYQKSSGLVEYAMQQSHPFAIKVLLLAGWEEPSANTLLHMPYPMQNVVNRVRNNMIQAAVQQHVQAADTIVRDYLEP